MTTKITAEKIIIKQYRIINGLKFKNLGLSKNRESKKTAMG